MGGYNRYNLFAVVLFCYSNVATVVSDFVYLYSIVRRNLRMVSALHQAKRKKRDEKMMEGEDGVCNKK